MNRYSKYILTTIFLFIILISQIGMHGSLDTSFLGIGIVVFILVNILLLINQNGLIKIPYLPKKFYFLMFAIIFFSSINYLITNRLKALIVYGILLILFLSIRIISRYISDKQRFISNLVMAVCVSGLIIFVLGYNNSFSYFRYSGFYTNSNSLGMICASLIHVTIGFLYSNIYTSIFRKLLSYLTLIISIFFLLATNSRAAILSTVIIICLVPIIELYKSVNLKTLRINIRYLLRFFLYAFLIAVLTSVLYSLGLFEYTVEKFNNKLSAGSVSDRRFESWLIMLENFTFLGHKNLLAISHEPLVLGHNTWLSHMNYNGLILLILFLIFLIWILNHSWKRMKINKFNEESSTILFFVLTGYIINATFETATSAPGLMISIVMFGVLYKKI